MMNRKTFLYSLLICLFAGSVAATAFAGEVAEREENQEQRIDKGVESGQLTGKEAARLEKGQRHVEKKRKKALADGKLTPREKKKLNHAQNVQSKKIRAAKHNGQTA